MTMAKGERTYQFKALTDLWTGDVDGKSDRLITTGLLGSIRWWFEVLVRGLGGSACDPTNTQCQGRNHCVVCELFGCTGWARKFRFEVLDKDCKIRETKNNQQTKISPQIKKGETFTLRFTPLRPIWDEEWALLDATLRLIAEYGAIGGKTVFKPTDEADRVKEIHHQDFGIVKIVKVDPQITVPKVMEVKKYILDERWRKPELKGSDFSWASLKCFWFVRDKTLTRCDASASSFNRVLGRKESKVCSDCGQVHNPPKRCPDTHKYPRRESEQLVNDNDDISRWLAGSQQESKKVFSFKNPARTFGFVKPCKTAADAKKEFDEMKKKRLDSVWVEKDWDFLTGDKIIEQLFAGKGDCT